MTRLLLLAASCAAGCGPTVVAQSSGQGSTSGAPADASSGTSSSSSSDGSSSSSSSDSTGGDASSTGESLEGPGCGIVPTCREQMIEGSVGITSLEDLEGFAGVTALTGDLEIAAQDLVCLDALACLRDVGGEVRILDNEALRSTAGLASIETVGTVGFRRSVVVGNNDVLETLEGFDALVSIFDALIIADNPVLRRIEGLSAVRGIGVLSISNNPALESLAGLHDVEQIQVCNVNLNPDLCISDVFEVCGDAEDLVDGVTNGNDEAC